MQFLFLASVFATACRAITSPDIYSITQPAGSSVDPGQASKPATNPATSRFATGPAAGVNVFLPNYSQNPNWLPLVHSLKTIGIPVKVTTTLSVTGLGKTLLIYTANNVTYNPSNADVTTLTNFVKTGGKLLFMSQVPTNLRTLAGIATQTANTAGTRSAMQLINAETTPQALRGFDFTDWYDTTMPIYDNYTKGLKNIGYKTNTGAVSLAKYFTRTGSGNTTKEVADTTATNSAIVKNQPSGSTGVVYTFGMDLGYLYIEAHNEVGLYFEHYDGYYFPGYDIMTRIIRNILTSNDHYVTMWPVANNMGIAFTTTWDIDTYVSYPHGQGIAAAAVERGAAGNLNLHVKYVTDAYERAYFQYGVPYIYQITGFRTAPDGFQYIDFGSHTISHSPNAVEFPYGTLSERYVQGQSTGYYPVIYECDATKPNGTPTNGETCIEGGTSGLSFWTSGGTIAGEVRVSAFLARYLLIDTFKTAYNFSTYRPGNLAYNKYQANMCVVNGFIGGSSCSGNAHLSHLPFQVGHNREPFQELPYYEFPLQWSDGDGNMSSRNFPGSDFAHQVSDIKKMARYGGHYNILIHPSDAMLDKIQIQRALHDAVRPFAVYYNQTGIANWWTNRDRAFVDITAASSTSATIQVRLDGAAEGLTLNVPRTYALQSVTGGTMTGCQQLSYDGLSNAIVLRNTAKGTFTLTFSVGTTASTVSTCPSLVTPALNECISWDVAVDDFLEDYFYLRGINLLLLPVVLTNLNTNMINGSLQLASTSAVNSYSTDISRFCFDATVYTHIYFDMVAPVGSSFSIQLVSYDSGCNSPVSSPTILDVSKYAAFDGKNHTVQIRLSDFAGQDLLNLRAIKLLNIAPVGVPVYIDNIKVQKRCVTAPGSDFTQGLTIDSFQNVDRWITGINDIFGTTDVDNSMGSAKLSELGKMQLWPSSASSYLYTNVDGSSLKNASSYTAVSLNVQGPAGGKFDVVVRSGASTELTVSTASYATLSPTTYSNITIPMTAFTGLNASTITRITLRNFSPFAGSAAANTFTLRWISLLGGPNDTATNDTCTPATGYVVLDFCDLSEFQTQTNSLGGPMTDGGSMQYYNQTSAGAANLVARDSTSAYTTQFNSTGCASIKSSNTGIVLTVSGPAGATASVGFRYSTGACRSGTTNTAFTTITLTQAPASLTIPFSSFAAPFNAQTLEAFIMTNFSVVGATYRIHSLVFVGTNDVPGCTLCMGQLIDTCTFVPTVPRLNMLGGYISDEATLANYSVAADGGLVLGAKAGSYWYSIFGQDGCYNATNATGVQVSLSAPANSKVNVALRWRSGQSCTGATVSATVPITNYMTFTGNGSNPQYRLATIPFTAFPGADVARLNSIALQNFDPATVTAQVGCISFVSGNGSTVIPPPANNTNSTSVCASCGSSAWLNNCAVGARVGANARNGEQSDDGTMRVAPAINNSAIVLQPAASGSYWYSILGCLDVSAANTLYITVTAPAGTSFGIKLQTSADATCANRNQLLASSDVQSSTYGAMTGNPVTLAIPLSAWSGQNLAHANAVILEAFSSGTAAYQIHCASFNSSASGAPGSPRNGDGVIVSSASLDSTAAASATASDAASSSAAAAASSAAATSASSAAGSAAATTTAVQARHMHGHFHERAHEEGEHAHVRRDAAAATTTPCAVPVYDADNA